MKGGHFLFPPHIVLWISEIALSCCTCEKHGSTDILEEKDCGNLEMQCDYISRSKLLKFLKLIWQVKNIYFYLNCQIFLNTPIRC